MSIEILFYTQLSSIIVFVNSLFLLYRVLVSQKDATIESLREKNAFLEHKLADAVQSKPDALAKSLSERVNHLNQEIERLSEDKVANRDLIAGKERELERVKEETKELSQQIETAQEMMGEFSVPIAKLRWLNVNVILNSWNMVVGKSTLIMNILPTNAG